MPSPIAWCRVTTWPDHPLAGRHRAHRLVDWLLQNPNLLLFATILPLIAVITISSWAGVVILLVLTVLVWAIAQTGYGAPLAGTNAAVILAAAIFNGLLWLDHPPGVVGAGRSWSMSGFDAALAANLLEMRERFEFFNNREGPASRQP